MFKVQSAKAKIFGTFKVAVSSGGPANIVGKYFYSPYHDYDRNKWWNIQSWWSDVNHTIQATELPRSTTDVVVLGPVAPIADLDRNDWVQPQSINTGSVGATFTSVQHGNISINIVGDATFTGNATYNV